MAPIWLAWCALLVLTAGTAAAQTGTLAGTVIDGDFRETVIGANVRVDGTDVITVTDIDGQYRLSLPVGAYTVRFAYVGLDAQTVNSVAVRSGETTELNIVLTSNALEEAVVEADAVIEQNSDVGLDRVRAASAAVSDAVSGETISRSGASDAGDAMERVTGASVQGGKYVFVRGLGDRYASTQLNGATLPTADPDRRSVQFDLFPASFLENIVTLKTFTPDRPGSFSGGLVDITTRSFPDAFAASLSVSSGLSTQVAPGGVVLQDPAAGVSLFGRADALDLPTDLLAQYAATADASGDIQLISRRELINPNTPEGQTRLEQLRLNEALVDFFQERPVAPGVGTADPNVSVAASVGNRVRAFGNDLGFIVGLTMNRGVGSYEEGITGRYQPAGDVDSQTAAVRQLRRDQRSTVESTLGGVGNLTYRIGTRNEIGLNTLFSQTAESQARVLSGLAPEFGNGPQDTTKFATDRVTGYTERSLASGQLRGRHELSLGAGLRAEWRANYAVTALNEPDLRFFANSVQREPDADPVIRVGGATLRNTLHFFRESTETLGGLGADFTLAPRSVLDLPVQLKAGFLFEQTERAFRERRFEILAEGLALGGESADSVAALFSPANSGVIRATPPVNPNNPRTTYEIGTIFRDNTQPLNQYDGALGTSAGYAMAEFPLFRGLRVVGGARVEQTRLGIDVVDIVTGEPVGTDSTLTGDPADGAAGARTSGSIDVTDVLPSLNLVYALRRGMNLRVAATRTLARPTFREIAPFASFDFATDGPLVGNPDLERTLITNLDLRYEWFNAPGSIVAVSGYHKLLDQPIERVIIDIENNVNQFKNVDQATILGAEFELRQALRSLGGVFAQAPIVRNLSVGGNLTVTQSRITIAAEELGLRREVDPSASDTRALQGQSPYIVNANLSYETPGTSIGAYFNVFGRRLARVGTVDVYEQPAPQLDVIASQNVMGQFAVKLTVRNLLASRNRELYDFPSSTLEALGGDAVYQSFSPGTSYSVGISFSPRFGGDTAPAVPPVPATTPAPAGL